jgi:hypothetical protein
VLADARIAAYVLSARIVAIDRPAGDWLRLLFNTTQCLVLLLPRSPCSYTVALGAGSVGAALFIGGFVVKGLQDD